MTSALRDPSCLRVPPACRLAIAVQVLLKIHRADQAQERLKVNFSLVCMYGRADTAISECRSVIEGQLPRQGFLLLFLMLAEYSLLWHLLALTRIT